MMIWRQKSCGRKQREKNKCDGTEPELQAFISRGVARGPLPAKVYAHTADDPINGGEPHPQLPSLQSMTADEECRGPLQHPVTKEGPHCITNQEISESRVRQQGHADFFEARPPVG